MRILYLAHRIPFPPNKGDKIRSYHHLRHLAARHEVHLCAFVDDAADEGGITSLREICRTVEIVRLDKRAALVRGVASLARGRSLSEGYFGGAAMHRTVARSAGGTSFDVVWGFSSVMAQFFGDAGARRSVIDFVDVDSEKWLQFARESRPPLRWLYALEASRLRAFECRAAASSDSVLFATAGEAALFASFAAPGAQTQVIENGVDTAYFQPRPARPAPPTLLFTGALDYRPNVDAVLWCAREVLPIVRRQVSDARLLAVGHRPSARLQGEAAAAGSVLEIAGSVPDVRPYFERAQAYVAPLRLGRGVQNKVLEAMAMRAPVVASPLAVAGLPRVLASHALVAESPEQFAAAIVSLLRDPERARRMGESARAAIEAHCTWPASLARLDACLEPRHEGAAQIREEAWTACLA